MSQLAVDQIGTLREDMDGPVLISGEADFDQARRVWNAGIDRYPAAIARCESAADVAAAIIFARAQGLDVSIRGGAHNTAGTAVCDGGLMIDLSALNAVTIDADRRRATVGGGALLADLDAAAQAHGLAVPAGLVSHTGVGGLTLGGGMGWLTRKFGLTIDNLISAEVVTAAGDVVRASAAEHPDLFWAIRGGGGNFGVVTSFEFRLHEVDPMVQLGMFFWPLDQGADALRLARDIVTTMPADVNAVIGAVNAPPAPFVPEQFHFAPGYVLLLTGFGSPGEASTAHADLVADIQQRLPPLFDLVTPIPYVQLQQLLDEANAWGSCAYEKGTYVEALSDDVIDVLTAHIPAKTSPMSLLLMYRLDGAYSEVSDDATAFSGGRSPRFDIFIVGVTPDSAALAGEKRWVTDFWDALRPYAIGSGDAYVNGMTDYQTDRVRGSYGPGKYERLARIKAKYDPGNVFHVNANIVPARPEQEPAGP
jgi:FAD/FMN-containing dehydrogenase